MQEKFSFSFFGLGIPEPCEVPQDFCKEKSMDSLWFRDCDGDGVKDAYCAGEELLKFGYVSSKNGCQNTWPNGLCMNEGEPSVDQAVMKPAAPNEVTIIHFNDVYQLSGVYAGGVRRGGLSRAAHVIKRERARNPDRTFAVFAGDLLSPSMLSDLFDGAQMVDIFNYLNLDAASLGNHEFDFGVDTLTRRIAESKFPWLNINLFEGHGLLNGTRERLIRDMPFRSIWAEPGKKDSTSRICFFGSTHDVRATMMRDKERLSWKNTIEAAKAEVRHLRQNQSCSIVIAMTHQFSRDDCELSRALGKDVDLILGGHDHNTEMKTMCGHAPYVKADSDLKTQWKMTLWLGDDGKVLSLDGKLMSLTDDDPFDVGVHDKVVEWEMKGEKEMGKVVGCTSQDLDAIDAHVRTAETNLGNLFCDSVKAMHNTQIVMINGGSIRGDTVYRRGDLDQKAIVSMHPFGNAIVKILASGAEIRGYLEDSLKCYEDACGSFPQVSGLKYSFDASAQPGARIVSLTLSDGSVFDDAVKYSVAMSDFMLMNSALKDCQLFEMTTLNDAVPIVEALHDQVAKAGGKCVNPRVDGRIRKMPVQL